MTPSIVFVHLNKKIPLYFRLNLLATRKNFPESKIILIHNQDRNQFLRKDIVQFRYTKSVLARDIERGLNHPKDFRENFWFASIARFDAIHSFMNENPGSVIHVESDVILSRDFPVFEFADPEFSIAYPVVADNRGVASTVYLKDADTSLDLTEFSLRAVNLNPMTTDMEILAQFTVEPKNQFYFLPFGPGDKLNYKDHNHLVNQSKRVPIEGVVDGNDIGVYLFGTDPRNTRGFSSLGTSIPGNYANIKAWHFAYNKERKFISLIDSGIEIPVYSIHATCKNKLLFFSFTRSVMIRIFIWSRRGNINKLFYPGAFLNLGLQKILKIFKGQKSVT